jgi:hypothetical protein
MIFSSIILSFPSVFAVIFPEVKTYPTACLFDSAPQAVVDAL